MQKHVPSEPRRAPVRRLDRKPRGTEHRQRQVLRRQAMQDIENLARCFLLPVGGWPSLAAIISAMMPEARASMTT
jgi:hypothetical protein